MAPVRRFARLELLVLLFALGAIGCTHTMEVKNLNEYSLVATAPRSLKLAVERNNTADEAARAMVLAARDGLASNSSVERVTMSGEAPPDFTPDYVVSIVPTSTYDGSGWNYLVTFPGFLIFTHAWNGFVYSAHTTTDIKVRRPGAPEVVAERNVETNWNFRHCDFGRGAWTSSGWYTPFYGGINLIIGFFMIQYDDDATLPLVAAIHDTYGQYIAGNVIEMATSAEPRPPTDALPSQSEVPPVPPAPPPE